MNHKLQVVLHHLKQREALLLKVAGSGSDRLDGMLQGIQASIEIVKDAAGIPEE